VAGKFPTMSQILMYGICDRDIDGSLFLPAWEITSAHLFINIFLIGEGGWFRVLVALVVQLQSIFMIAHHD
jgi:hypothetical protein